MKLDRHPVGRHALGYELHPHGVEGTTRSIRYIEVRYSRCTETSDKISNTNLKLHKHPVDIHALGYELHPQGMESTTRSIRHIELRYSINRYIEDPILRKSEPHDTILHTNLKLDRHPVDRHALGYELHPHRALEILAELVVVKPSD